eukprot:6539388-Pyramimonas_sp.AAC.1
MPQSTLRGLRTARTTNASDPPCTIPQYSASPKDSATSLQVDTHDYLKNDPHRTAPPTDLTSLVRCVHVPRDGADIERASSSTEDCVPERSGAA